MKEIQLHRIDLNLLVVFQALMLEGSVAGAASKLNKTPSAVSHALARLREQVGDPLMVKVGGRMQPSPFALQLIEDIGPILNSIKRVLRLPEAFAPGSSDRTFRIACPMMTGLLSRVMKKVQQKAPNIRIEWLSAPRDVFAAVSEGLIDMAFLGGYPNLPDGLDEIEIPPLQFVTFLREGHPAISTWGPEAWAQYGHIKVALSNDARSPVDTAAPGEATRRHVSVLIAEFAGVPPILSRSDMIATLPSILLAPEMQRHGLRPMRAIWPVPPFRARFYWSARTANDPALVWLRDIVLNAHREAHEEAETLVREGL